MHVMLLFIQTLIFGYSYVFLLDFRSPGLKAITIRELIRNPCGKVVL